MRKLGVFAGCLLLASCNSGNESPALQNDADKAADAVVQPGTVNQAGIDDLLKNHPWSYEKKSDEMGRGAIITATASSTNSVDLGAPYDGGTTEALIIRRHPRDGTNVLLSANRGQLNCDDIDGCHVYASFDGHKPVRFSAMTPSDGSREALFISPSSKMIDLLRSSKTVVFEIEFYDNGMQHFRFNTGGLHWPPRDSDL